MMVRPLSKELQKIAVEELHENPESVEENIKHLQEWIQQQAYLNAPKGKQWILGFLRGCKFNLEKTKEKFDRYYTLKTLIPQILQARDVHSEEIQAMLKAGMVFPLPYSINHKGPRIILFDCQKIDTSIMNHVNLTALFNMVLNILMVEDDNLIISGFLLLIDLTGFPVSFISQFTPTFTRNLFECLNNGFPLRIKAIHYLGTDELTKRLLMVLKGYFGSKLKHRIFVHSEDDFESISKVIPKSYMPKEYNGENGNLEELKDYWKTKVESYSTWFTENNQYRTTESLRPGKPASLDDVIGNDGSFEKLNID